MGGVDRGIFGEALYIKSAWHQRRPCRGYHPLGHRTWPAKAAV